MRVIDASSIIYGWDNYPPEQFPKLWAWVAEEIESAELVIPKVAFDEVKNKLPECADWLTEQNISKLSPTNDVLRKSLEIHALLGIVGDAYGKGAGENDILIIATAFVAGGELITNENVQNNLPSKLKNCKIPAVCGLPEVRVTYSDFLQYIRSSKQVFG